MVTELEIRVALMAALGVGMGLGIILGSFMRLPPWAGVICGFLVVGMGLAFRAYAIPYLVTPL